MLWVQGGLNHLPHMPRSGAPQAPQGPGSAAESVREPPATAKTESNFSTFALPHFLQVAAAELEATIFSNVAPQLRHSYSKMGMPNLPPGNIPDVTRRYNRKPGRVTRCCGLVAPAFFQAPSGLVAGKALDSPLRIA